MAETRRSLGDTAIQLSGEAVSFIDHHKKEPFFLFYPTTDIHYPLTPNEKFQGRSNAGVYGDFVIDYDWVVGQILEATPQRPERKHHRGAHQRQRCRADRGDERA